MANRDDLSTSTSGTSRNIDWTTEDQYWRTNWNTRPYVSADRGYDYYRPGYQYGYEAANRYRGREWNDVDGHQLPPRFKGSLRGRSVGLTGGINGQHGDSFRLS